MSYTALYHQRNDWVQIYLGAKVKVFCQVNALQVTAMITLLQHSEEIRLMMLIE